MDCIALHTRTRTPAANTAPLRTAAEEWIALHTSTHTRSLRPPIEGPSAPRCRRKCVSFHPRHTHTRPVRQLRGRLSLGAGENAFHFTLDTHSRPARQLRGRLNLGAGENAFHFTLDTYSHPARQLRGRLSLGAGGQCISFHPRHAQSPRPPVERPSEPKCRPTMHFISPSTHTVTPPASRGPLCHWVPGNRTNGETHDVTIK
jgi:hypothetical protein